MVTASDVLTYSLIGGAIAYVINFNGFKDWLDARVGTGGAFGEPQPQGQDQFQLTGGSGKTVQEEQQDIISKLLNPTPPRVVATPKVTPPNAPLGKCFTYQGLNCWRNYQCGGSQVSVCGKASCQTVYQNWVSRYGCKTQTQTGAQCPYAGCTNRLKGPGCFLCRCANICKAYPNTHGQVKADGSCKCIPNLSTGTVGGTSAGAGCPASLMTRCQGICASYPGTVPHLNAQCSCSCRSAYRARAFATATATEELDEGLMQVPTLS